MKKMFSTASLFLMLSACGLAVADVTVNATVAPGAPSILGTIWGLIVAYAIPAILTGGSGKILYDLLFKAAKLVGVPMEQLPSLVIRLFVWLTGIVLVPVWNKLSPGHTIDPTSASGVVETLLLGVLPLILHHAAGRSGAVSPASVTVKS